MVETPGNNNREKFAESQRDVVRVDSVVDPDTKKSLWRSEKPDSSGIYNYYYEDNQGGRRPFFRSTLDGSDGAEGLDALAEQAHLNSLRS